MSVVELGRPAAGEPNRPMVTLVAMTATIMQVLDTTIANVALPHMQGSLGATQDQIAWVLTSYIVAAAIGTPVTAWLAGRFGRTRLFVVALSGFTLASILCGIAVSLPEIVLFRLLQGLFGAALVPLSQSILLDTYPRNETARAMGIFSMGVMVGPILGPIIGGYLTDQYSWRWCFYINVPLGIIAIFGALAFFPETARRPGRRLDWMGFGFLSLAIVSLQLALDRGEQQGWFQSNEIIIETVLTAFALYMFVVHSTTTARPFFDVRLFKDRTFVVATALTSLIFIVFYGSMALLPQMLQGELDYPVMTAGLIMSPRGAGTIASILVLRRLGRWFGDRAVIATGLIFNATAMYLMSGWSLMVDPSDIIVVGLMQGIGTGFINVPLATIAFSNLAAEVRTEAAGFYNLMRNIGSAAGVSLSASQLVEFTQINHGRLAEFMTPFGHLPSAPGLSGHAALSMLNASLTRQASMVAYINVYWMLGALCILILPLVMFLRVGKIDPGHAAVVGE